ncbi:MAG: hypothetical protein J6A73_08010 [Lachnospiraceae bacterium]|nr:hypothetical protein [Lachnospiraceae bacterium]
MVSKCLKCDGALEFNPSCGKMECPYCGSFFEPEAVMQPISRVMEQAEEPQTIHMNQNDTWETMECKIYSCTSCGGELMVNDVEASTFCAYCGQPTVVFKRVSRELKPKYILPFQITKDEAVRIIRSRFSSGVLVPDEIKNFEVEKLRGIYIPYFLYNIYCYDLQVLEGRDKNNVPHRYLREAECEYKGIPVEASYHLNDDVSRLLGGFDFRQLKQFEPSYLSGFYADKYDIDTEKAKNTVVERVLKDFNRKIKWSVPIKQPQILEQHPKQEIKNHDYVMLPVWFMTFLYKNEVYTMLVNGQNGEVVGAVPYKKSQVTIIFISLTIVFTILFSMLGGGIGMMIMKAEAGDRLKLLFDNLIFVVIGNVALYSIGLALWRTHHKRVKATKEKRMVGFVKDRQEDT